jgi:hypothetical protein
VSFTKDNRRRFEPGRSRFVLPSFLASPMVRLLAFALVAAVGAAWALIRHYTVTMPPMHVPVAPAPVPAPTFDADAGEIPVPEWLPGTEGDP